MTKLLFLLVFVLCSNVLLAQYQQVDSLLDEADYPDALAALKAIDFHQFSKKEQAVYYKWLGEAHRLAGEYEDAFENLNKGLSFLDFNASTKIAAQLQNELSMVTRAIYSYDDALNHSRKALEIATIVQDSNLLYKTHLILGNAFYSKGWIDSTVKCYENALIYLSNDNLKGKALILNNTGNVCLRNELFEEAVENFEAARELFLQIEKLEEANMALLNKAAAQLELNQIGKAKANLEKGLTIAKTKNWDQQTSIALNGQMHLIAKSNNLPVISELLDSIEEAEHRIFDKELLKVQEAFENDKLESQLVTERLQSQKRSSTIKFLLLSLALLAFGFGMYFYNQRLKTKLAKSQAEIKRKEDLEAERTRIASEMHDDLGGGLTTIKYLSQKVLRKIEDGKPKEEVGKIVNQAQTLVGNMSEIIWAMNAGFDTLESFVGYTRRYIREYLEDFDMALDFKVQDALPSIKISGEKRRNLFLIVKEAVHNAVKHANADRISMNINILSNDQLQILIKDNGKGLASETTDLGNGLRNMQARASAMDAKLTFHNDQGLHINIKVPI